MQPAAAQLHEAILMLRTDQSGRVDADCVLMLRTPEGIERWSFDWGLQDVDLETIGDKTPREHFDVFMRSLFDDHMADLAERGLAPDRRYDELPVRIEIPPEILRRMN
jgi:hypothetical protein